MKKRIYRTEKDKKICGVCGGLAEYLDMDPTLMRLLWVLIACLGAGSAFIAYIIAAIIVPTKSEVEKQMREETIEVKAEFKEEKEETEK